MKKLENLIPITSEAILYSVITAIVVIIGNLGFLTNFLTEGTDSSAETFKAQASGQLSELLQFVDGLAFTPSAAVFFFWGLAGVLAFSLIQSLINLYSEIKTDVDITAHFLHPRNFTNRKFWLEVIYRAMIHTVLLGFALAITIVLLGFLAPLAVATSRLFFENIGLTSGLEFVLSSLFLFLGVMILSLTLRLLFRRNQI